MTPHNRVAKGKAFGASGSVGSELRYCRYQQEIEMLGGEGARVRCGRTGKSRVLDLPRALILLVCDSLRLLQEHARDCVERIPADKLAPLGADGRSLVEAVRECLECFVADGLLEPEEAILGEFLGGRESPAAPPLPVSSLCIPTCGRPRTLQRALASYLDTDVRYGRDTAFVIMDDTRDAAVQRQNLAVLELLRTEYPRRFFYAGRGHRERYARALSSVAGVLESTVEFALLGDARYGASYGATRNAMLLDTPGELCVQVDDDLMCQVSRPPGATDDWVLTAQDDANEYWFFERPEDVHAGVRFTGEDYLGVHERVLGRAPADAALHAGQGSLGGNVTPGFIADARHPAATVAVSYTGLSGDCGGAGDHHWRLMLGHPSFGRLVAGEGGFEARLHSRQLIKCPTRVSIGNGAYCMTHGMGVDNRALLPPFIPVLAAEDILFGAMRKVLFRRSFVALLPRALVHAPEETRTSSDPLEPLTFKANLVLCTLLAVFAPGLAWESEPSALMEFGAFLRDLSTMPPPRFAGFVRDAVQPRMRLRGRQVEFWLQDRADAPPYWRRSMETFAAQIRTLLAEGDPAAPADLPGRPHERQAAFQALVGNYGDLLFCWPRLREAATELRTRGVRISEPV